MRKRRIAVEILTKPGGEVVAQGVLHRQKDGSYANRDMIWFTETCFLEEPTARLENGLEFRLSIGTHLLEKDWGLALVLGPLDDG